MKDKLIKSIKETIPYIIIILVVVLIRSYIITPVRVDGTSMNPTLENKNILILNKFEHNYKRFDVIVFRYDGRKLVKRVIGLPGETVEYKNNKLYINGKQIKETFEHKDTDDYVLKEKIPDKQYFVLGDNRSNSLDSRFIGLIHKNNIEGIVDFSIIPFKKLN